MINRAPRNYPVVVVLYIVGLALTFAFQMDVLPAPPVAVVAIYGVAGAGIWFVRTQSLAILSRLIIFLFFLPFSATAGYLVNPEFYWWDTPGTRELLAQDHVVRVLLTSGLIGLLGLIIGILIGTAREKPAVTHDERSPNLDRVGFSLLTLLAVFFSWLFAPSKTIFEAAYSTPGTEGIATSIYLNAASLQSYVLMNLLFIDAQRSSRGRRWKYAVVLTATAYIVIYLQLLRGDRESIGLVASLMALYVSTSSGIRQRARAILKASWKRLRHLVILGIVLVAVFDLIGFVRSTGGEMPDFDAGTRIKALVTLNTWTTVLITNLGMSAEYDRGMEYLYGRTYLDYLLSLPPGVVTHFFGIERPIEGTHGPAWWYMGLSVGGIHMLVVPFKNFGALGVFLIMILAGWFVGQVDSHSRRGIVWRLVYASTITSSFFWVWYGDLSLVRGIMAAGFALIPYGGWMFVSMLLRTVPRPVRQPILRSQGA